MGILDTIRGAFDGPDDRGKTRFVAAYWCDDCDVRLPVEEVHDEPRPCPDCGEPMRLERSPDSGSCAC